jgi:uncharacterized LabA/DUF88 family protein
MRGMMERIIAYIDGYNLYYGLREKGWKWSYWLNLQSMIQRFLRPGQSLVRTKYFTSIVNRPASRHSRQAVYLEVLQTLTDFDILYGHFLADTVTCLRCGHIYDTHHEKMTDVNIAVELLSDAFLDHFDTAFLVSADSDLVGPIRAVKDLFNSKKVLVIFPPARRSDALKREAHAYTYLGRDKLLKSQFPNEVIKPDGFILRRPNSWK